MDNQIFPSLVISTATIQRPPSEKETYFGDQLGMIGVDIENTSENSPFEVEISSSKYIRSSMIKGIFKKAGLKYSVFPQIDYDFDALYQVIEPIPETISFRVKINGVEEIQKKIIQIRSINECLHYSIDSKGKGQDFKGMFAAYVNENDPLVDKVLQAALKLRLVDKFSGYQEGPKQVFQQAYAIWNVFQRQGIKYSDITTSSAASKKVFSQYVRFFDDTLKNTQANCVDGSVLFTSIYRKIGLNAFLVIVPQHCYMGFYLDENKKLPPIIVETTMIGRTDLRMARTEAQINDMSWKSFGDACKYGADEFEKVLREDKSKENLYRIVDIEKAREIGIQPLKSKSIK